MSMKNNDRLSLSKTTNTRKVTKVNKKRLIFVFFTAFIFFFFICSYLASMFTPSINIPALNNNGEGVSVTSDDFKGRIDPRLRSIEMQEDTPFSPSQQSNSNKAADKSLNNDMQSGKNPSEDSKNTVNPDLNADNSQQENYNQPSYGKGIEPYYDQNTDQEEPDQNRSTTQNPTENSRQQSVPVLKPPVPKVPVTKREYPNQNTAVQEEANNKPIRMTKIIVGHYSSPADARKASQELTNSNLNVIPFIVEKNGTYSLQVGSFSSQKKADNLVNALRNKNMSVKVVVQE